MSKAEERYYKWVKDQDLKKFPLALLVSQNYVNELKDENKKLSNTIKKLIEKINLLRRY